MPTMTAEREFVFEAPLRGSWTRADLRTPSHEANHSVVAVLLGLRVLETRIDRPDRGVAGHCAIDNTGDLWRHAAFFVAGPVGDGKAPDAPDFMSSDVDIWRASVALHDAGPSAPSWTTLCDIVLKLLRLPASRRAGYVLAGELLDRGALPGDEVERIVNGELAEGQS